jgi:hypothetical protein
LLSWSLLPKLFHLDGSPIGETTYPVGFFRCDATCSIGAENMKKIDRKPSDVQQIQTSSLDILKANCDPKK